MTMRSTYQQLLNKSSKSAMSINRLKPLCVKVFQTLNELNPSFIKNIFNVKETDRLTRERQKQSLKIPSYNQVTSGYESLRMFKQKF